MRKSKHLGEFEIIVLAALIRLADDAYGVKIREEIETRSGRKASVGALYATLSRLENKGYVSSHTGEATAERGGRAKRYYQITASGEESFQQSVRTLSLMLNGLPEWSTA
ncbi:MAG: helix-turn-helix transcriptional regulator [Pseudomonadota bacterium]